MRKRWIPAVMMAVLVWAMAAGAGAEAKKPFALTFGEARARTCKSGVRMVITPTDGFKMNLEYPTRLTASAPSRVVVKKPTQTKADAVTFVHAEAVFDVCYEIPAGPAPQGEVQATIKFSVCNDERCIMFTEMRSTPLAPQGKTK